MAEAVQDSEQLSLRERQIAQAYAGGQNYRQIAEQLFIAPATVRTHLGTIYRKLGVSSKIADVRLEEIYHRGDPLRHATAGLGARSFAANPMILADDSSAPSPSVASGCIRSPTEELARRHEG